MTIQTVAKKGDRLETLRAMRDGLAAAMDPTTEGWTVGIVAQVAAQLAKVLAEIEELEGRKPAASISEQIRDELKAKREATAGQQDSDAPARARRRR